MENYRYFYETDYLCQDDLDKYYYDVKGTCAEVLNDKYINKKECIVKFSECSTKLISFTNNKELAIQVIRLASTDVCMNEYTNFFNKTLVKFQSYSSKYSAWIDLEKGETIASGSELKAVFVFKNESCTKFSNNVSMVQNSPFMPTINDTCIATTLTLRTSRCDSRSSSLCNSNPQLSVSKKKTLKTLLVKRSKKIVRYETKKQKRIKTTIRLSRLDQFKSESLIVNASSKKIASCTSVSVWQKRKTILENNTPQASISKTLEHNGWPNHSTSSSSDSSSDEDSSTSDGGSSSSHNSSYTHKKKKYSPVCFTVHKKSAEEKTTNRKDVICRNRSRFRSFDKKEKQNLTEIKNKASAYKTTCYNSSESSSNEYVESKKWKSKNKRKSYRNRSESSDENFKSCSTPSDRGSRSTGFKEVAFQSRKKKYEVTKRVHLVKSDGESVTGEKRKHVQKLDVVKYKINRKSSIIRDSEIKGNLELPADNKELMSYKNPICVVYETCQKNKWPAPVFRTIVEKSYPKPEYQYKVVVNGEEYSGKSRFSRKQAAKADAALAYLRSHRSRLVN